VKLFVLPEYRRNGIATQLCNMLFSHAALLHKDLKCKAPLIEPNLRRNLGKWST
ncbi:GNAT family N-acetyltransferase, partial [Acinetobacter pittii]|uniref:GNAT family N-acetyltransferase n=1 Tax=Acinetobacter pittii TaxID=48296 RepID=UPI00397748CF